MAIAAASDTMAAMTTGEASGGATPPRASGRHAGARRAERPAVERSARWAGVAWVVAMVLAVVAWCFLAWSAIGFGRDARAGDDRAWWFLGTASVGAIGCLFLALIIGARLMRRWGITRDPALPARPVGGRRVKR